MAKKGKLFLIKSGVVTVANVRSTGVSISGELVDVTTKDSLGQREALASAGISSVSFSASGVWANTTEQKAFIARALDGSANTYSIVNEDGAAYSGSFVITSFSESAEFNGSEDWDVTMESAAAITYTAV